MILSYSSYILSRNDVTLPKSLRTVVFNVIISFYLSHFRSCQKTINKTLVMKYFALRIASTESDI